MPVLRDIKFIPWPIVLRVIPGTRTGPWLCRWHSRCPLPLVLALAPFILGTVQLPRGSVTSSRQIWEHFCWEYAALQSFLDVTLYQQVSSW